MPASPYSRVEALCRCPGIGERPCINTHYSMPVHRRVTLRAVFPLVLVELLHLSGSSRAHMR